MKKENAAFIQFDHSTNGLIFDDSNHKKYPIRYFNVIEGKAPEINSNSSYYGYVYSGQVIIENSLGEAQRLSEGMFFSSSTLTSIKDVPSETKSGLVLIEVLHDKGMYPENKFKSYSLFGGPIENEGRLKYIDGCTDSLLISPVKLGDPCLNHLHFPKNITQTQHTHPSHRIGIVAKGEGTCITPFGNLPLRKNMIFVIKEYDGKSMTKGLDGNMHPNGQHSFETVNSSMDVIAFHPDSDFGATDVDHPMINRTIVGGVSANTLEEIRTK